MLINDINCMKIRGIQYIHTFTIAIFIHSLPRSTDITAMESDNKQQQSLKGLLVEY